MDSLYNSNPEDVPLPLYLSRIQTHNLYLQASFLILNILLNKPVNALGHFKTTIFIGQPPDYVLTTQYTTRNKDEYCSQHYNQPHGRKYQPRKKPKSKNTCPYCQQSASHMHFAHLHRFYTALYAEYKNVLVSFCDFANTDSHIICSYTP